jgi:hypothetical protein
MNENDVLAVRHGVQGDSKRTGPQRIAGSADGGSSGRHAAKDTMGTFAVLIGGPARGSLLSAVDFAAVPKPHDDNE